MYVNFPIIYYFYKIKLSPLPCHFYKIYHPWKKLYISSCYGLDISLGVFQKPTYLRTTPQTLMLLASELMLMVN